MPRYRSGLSGQSGPARLRSLPVAGLSPFGARRRRAGELGRRRRQSVDAMRVQRTDGHQQFLARSERIYAQLGQVLGRQRGEHVDVDLVDDERA